MTGPGSECACRLMAQMRSVDRVRKCLLFGVDGTYCGRHETDAFDPKRTWLNSLLDHLVGDGRFPRPPNRSAQMSFSVPWAAAVAPPVITAVRRAHSSLPPKPMPTRPMMMILGRASI